MSKAILKKIVVYLKGIVIYGDFPDDCSDPKVLKSYLKGCQENACKILKLLDEAANAR